MVVVLAVRFADLRCLPESAVASICFVWSCESAFASTQHGLTCEEAWEPAGLRREVWIDCLTPSLSIPPAAESDGDDGQPFALGEGGRL